MDNRIFLSNSSFTWSWHIMIFHVNKSGFCFPKLLLLNSSICQLLLDGARTALLGTPQLVGGFTKKCQPLFAPVESEVMKLSALANGILGIYILYIIYIYIIFCIYIYIIYIIYTAYHLIPFNWRNYYPHSIYLCHPPGEITGITGITVARHFDGCSLVILFFNRKRQVEPEKTVGKCADIITATNKWYKWMPLNTIVSEYVHTYIYIYIYYI